MSTEENKTSFAGVGLRSIQRSMDATLRAHEQDLAVFDEILMPDLPEHQTSTTPGLYGRGVITISRSRT